MAGVTGRSCTAPRGRWGRALAGHGRSRPQLLGLQSLGAAGLARTFRKGEPEALGDV